ncbi:hypothetical protein [Kluyvera sp. CHPC 1.251]|uniref:hypothetical protein n=1 Tax=Kluyvera sp. CHPC 1.251 TaxID=2995175 RepID=UPI002FD7A228
MYKQSTKSNDNLKRTIPYSKAKSNSVVKQCVQLYDGRPNYLLKQENTDLVTEKLSQTERTASYRTIQKVSMKAGEGELSSLEEFQTDCDVMYGMLKSKVLSDQWVSCGLSMSNFDVPKWDEYLSKTFIRTYGSKDKTVKKVIIDNFKIRAKNDELGSVSLSEEPGDIEINLESLKACVITALLYAEGGSLLGARSVEGLHQILINRFPKTFGQYSDDNVIDVLYPFFNYKKTTVSGKVKDVIGKYNKGMVSISGHMIGFAKKGDSYELKDNEGVAENITNHKYKNGDASVIWTK